VWQRGHVLDNQQRIAQFKQGISAAREAGMRWARKA
jgi:hypothetical protein